MKKPALNAGILAVAMMSTASALAAPTFNYNYVEGGAGQLDEGEAIFVNAAKDINKNWGIVGGLEIGSVDPDFDVTLFEVGAQYHQPVDAKLSWHAGLKLLYVKVEGDISYPGFGVIASVDEDEIGFVANGGVRFRVNPQFQLEGDIKLIQNDAVDDGLGLQGAARYYIDPKLSVAGGLALDTELDGLFVSLRYDL